MSIFSILLCFSSTIYPSYPLPYPPMPPSPANHCTAVSAYEFLFISVLAFFGLLSPSTTLIKSTVQMSVWTILWAFSSFPLWEYNITTVIPPCFIYYKLIGVVEVQLILWNTPYVGVIIESVGILKLSTVFKINATLWNNFLVNFRSNYLKIC